VWTWRLSPIWVGLQRLVLVLPRRRRICTLEQLEHDGIVVSRRHRGLGSLSIEV
jgi:hypothetical protein